MQIVHYAFKNETWFLSFLRKVKNLIMLGLTLVEMMTWRILLEGIMEALMYPANVTSKLLVK